MEFVLTFQQSAEIYEGHSDPASLLPWKHYMEAMGAAGVMRGGNRLNALAVTSVQVRNGKRQVQDGPFADSKELLGGYVVIDVPSLDEALRWAERSPSSLVGTTSVWPVNSMGASA